MSLSMLHINSAAIKVWFSCLFITHYITSHPGQLSLAIPPWVGAMSTSQRVVMLCAVCGWGVKAGMVCEWVAGNTV